MEVDLDGDERLVLALGGLELDIDLRAVERRLALGLVEVEANLLQDAAQERFAGLPHRRVVDVLLVVVGVAQREAVRVVLQTQDAIHLFHQVQDALDLLLHLGGIGAEDVGVVERHDAHAAHARELAGLLPAVHVAQLGDADGQLAVGVLGAHVHHDVAGAIHRTQDILLTFALHHRVHRIAEVVPVAGFDVELALGHGRRDDVLIAAFDLEILDPPLQLAADGGAGRQPDDVARTHFIDEVEEL